jgi:hypothetical protein
MSGKLVGTVTLLVPEDGAQGTDWGLGSFEEAEPQKQPEEMPLLKGKSVAMDEHGQRKVNPDLKNRELSENFEHKQDTVMDQRTQTPFHSNPLDKSSPIPIFHLPSTTTESAARILHDVQLWGNDSFAFSGKFSFVSYVNVSLIPLYLISGAPCRVYTTSTDTTKFFQNQVASCIGSGAMFVDTDTYLVFYSDHDHKIWGFKIDFGFLEKLQLLSIDPDTITSESAHDVFERVLSDKRRKKQSNKFMLSNTANPVTQLSTQHFTSSEQVSQAIGKLILSGLRLRGVTTNSPSPNDRVAVREIYQMTQKAAIFAVRKFSYNFQPHEKIDLTLDHLQDIVEHLLQVFIDVDAQ